MARMTKLQQVAQDFVERRTHAAASKNMSGSLHNRGEVAYSYKQRIAVHTSDNDGPFILMTTRRFSVTTSKHQSAIRRAAAQAGHRVIDCSGTP